MHPMFGAPEPEKPLRSLVFEATERGAQEMDKHTRNTALNARFTYNRRIPDQPARLLEEPVAGDLTRSSEWVIVEPGDTVVRLGSEQDAPLRVQHMADPAASAAAFEE